MLISKIAACCISSHGNPASVQTRTFLVSNNETLRCNFSPIYNLCSPLSVNFLPRVNLETSWSRSRLENNTTTFELTKWDFTRQRQSDLLYPYLKLRKIKIIFIFDVTVLNAFSENFRIEGEGVLPMYLWTTIKIELITHNGLLPLTPFHDYLHRPRLYEIDRLNSRSRPSI
jgi:hypothetical protein